MSPSSKKDKHFVSRPLNGGDSVSVGDEIFFFSEERLKIKASEMSPPENIKKSGSYKLELNDDELPKQSPLAKRQQLTPCENKERSLDCPSARLKSNARNKNADKSPKDSCSKSLVKIQVENCYKESAKSTAESPEDNKGRISERTSPIDGCTCDPTVRNRKLSEDHYNVESVPNTKKHIIDNKNKFTWCGSCKSSKSGTSVGSKAAAAAAAAVAATHERQFKAGKRTSSTSPLKRLSRSSLSAHNDTADNKIALNLSKYSPCASRLAASSKILSNDAISPESPLHVARSKSPLGTSLSLNVQQLQKSNAARSKSDDCVTSPISDATSTSPPTTEIMSLEDVSTKHAFEDHQERECRWSSNHRSPR